MFNFLSRFDLSFFKNTFLALCSFIIFGFVFNQKAESAITFTHTQTSNNILEGGHRIDFYTVTLTTSVNHTVGQVTFNDTLPTNFNIPDISWTCTSNGTSRCAGTTASGLTSTSGVADSTGKITINLGDFNTGAGNTIVIKISVRPFTSGTGIINTASTTRPGPVTESGNSPALTVTANTYLTGRVFEDKTGNAVFDYNDEPISGVPITLYDRVAGTCNVINSDAKGYYTFNSLIAYTGTSPYDGESGSNTNNPGRYKVYQNDRLASPCGAWNAATGAGGRLSSPASSTMGGTTPLSDMVVPFTNQRQETNFGNIQLSSLAPFETSCPVDGFLSENRDKSRLNAVDIKTNIKNALGLIPGAGFEYNATGFNTNDRFIYGIGGKNRTASTDTSELVKIDRNGLAVSLGHVEGLPDITSRLRIYFAGDYNPFDGKLYVSNIFPTATATVIYKIDLSLKKVDSTITTSITSDLLDFAFNPISEGGVNYIYGVPRTGTVNTIYKINPSTGTSSSFIPTSLPVPPSSSAGSNYVATFFDPDNNLYVEDTNTQIFQIVLTTSPDAGTASTFPSQPSNPLARADGARCPFGKVSVFDAYPNNQSNAIAGATVIYPHELYTSIFGTGTVTLSVNSNNGWTYNFYLDNNNDGILNNGDTQITDSSITVGTFTNTESKKILVKLQVPQNAAGNTIIDTLTINATLTLSNGIILQKTITDTTTVSTFSSGVLRLQKSAISYASDGTTVSDATGKTIKPNGFIVYTLTYTNIGTGILQNLKISDLVPNFTTFQNANPVGTCANTGVLSGGKITWTIPGTLATGQSGCVNFRVKVD
ncbi:MAG: hypothetical protein U0457_04270 [Candidatus Sericytochromatia bacterium]